MEPTAAQSTVSVQQRKAKFWFRLFIKIQKSKVLVMIIQQLREMPSFGYDYSINTEKPSFGHDYSEKIQKSKVLVMIIQKKYRKAKF